jgi:HSP20 family protein
MTENSMQVEKDELMGPETEQTRDRRVFSPATDIYETDDEILLMVDLPGAKEDNVDITLEKDILSIDAIVEVDPPEGFSLRYAEYAVGDYHRKFRLAKLVDPESITAIFQDGVLKLTLAKSSFSHTRKIAIQAK